jgi:hypothetical protein
MTDHGHPGDALDDSGLEVDDASRSNGSGHAAPGAAPEVSGGDERADASAPTPVAGLDEVEWHVSYDRESVDRFLAEVEEEKARLTAAIAAAEAREAEARERLATQKAYNEEQLGALVVSARTELDRVEKEHADAVAAIRAEALEKAARILESARREADAVGDASQSLARVVPGDAVDDPTPGASERAVAEDRTDVG